MHRFQNVPTLQLRPRSEEFMKQMEVVEKSYEKSMEAILNLGLHGTSKLACNNSGQHSGWSVTVGCPF